MAIQISVPKNAVPYGVNLSNAYVRITNANIDWAGKNMTFQASIWADKESRDGNKQPIMPVQPIYIRSEPTPANFRIKTDAQGQQVMVDGEPVMEQTSPSFPSFDQVELLIGEAILANEDYRKVGYDLLKKVDIIKNNNPQDV